MIRNPFVHLKSFDHQFTVGQRMMATKEFSMPTLLENDAKEALIAMHGVAIYAFGHR